MQEIVIHFNIPIRSNQADQSKNTFSKEPTKDPTWSNYQYFSFLLTNCNKHRSSLSTSISFWCRYYCQTIYFLLQLLADCSNIVFLSNKNCNYKHHDSPFSLHPSCKKLLDSGNQYIKNQCGICLKQPLKILSISSLPEYFPIINTSLLNSITSLVEKIQLLWLVHHWKEMISNQNLHGHLAPQLHLDYIWW